MNTPTVTPEHLKALAVIYGINHVGDRSNRLLLTYNNLLEEDWEGRSSALKYIHDGNAMLQQMLKMGSVLKNVADKEVSLELLPLESLVVGVADKLGIGSDDVSQMASATSNYVMGHVFLLQELLQELLKTIDDTNAPGRLAVKSVKRSFTQSELKLMHTELSEGDYVALAISNGALTENPQEDFVNARNFLADEDKVLQYLSWIGAVAMHKGELLFHKEGIDKGAMLLLPAAAGGDETNLRARIVNGHPETILLVDDADAIWDVVITILQNFGYQVLLAENGKYAVEIYGSNTAAIDLILLDMVMPEMNARDAFPLLKKINPDVKVLLASGYVEEKDVQDLLNAGAKGFMNKPYHLKDLVKRIRDILDKR